MTEINSYTYGERGSLSTLNITMADRSDAGGYVCMATNVAGRDTSAVELTVHGKCQMIVKVSMLALSIMNAW